MVWSVAPAHMLRFFIVWLLCVQVFFALSLVAESPYVKWTDSNDGFASSLNLLQWRARWHGPQPDGGDSGLTSELQVQNIQVRARQGLVWSDPELEKYDSASDGGFQKVLVQSGSTPYLERLSFRQLPPGPGAQVQGEADTTVLYFALNGSCLVGVPATGEREVIKRGGSVLVPPGVNHQVRSAEEPSKTTINAAPDLASRCTVLAVNLPSGSWTATAQGTSNSGATTAAVVAGLNSPFALRVADTGHLQSEKTAHESDLLSKRVHVRKGVVPGLLQLSVARFAPGALCDEHQHPTAAEVYVNYSGSGCHVAAMDPVLGHVEHDLTGGKVAIIKPGTLHTAWNDADGDCQNINIMINDAREPV